MSDDLRPQRTGGAGDAAVIVLRDPSHRSHEQDLSRRPWWVRAAVNAGCLAGCLAATVYARAIFGPGGST